MRFEIHGSHAVCSHLLQRSCGDWVREKTIHHEASIYVHGQKSSWICAARAKRVNEWTGGEYNGIATVEIRCGHRKRNPQLLERMHFQDTCEQTCHGIGRPKAEAGEGQAREVAKSEQPSDFFQFFSADTAGEHGRDNSSAAGACDVVNGNALLLENFQYSDMSDAAGESAALTLRTIRLILSKSSYPPQILFRAFYAELDAEWRWDAAAKVNEG
jgi:hypothetical protein